jgi:hypothetical protein
MARASVVGSLTGVIIILIWPHSATTILAPFWFMFYLLAVGMIIYDFVGRGNPATRLWRYGFFVLFLIVLAIGSSINSLCTKSGGNWTLSLSGIHYYEVCNGFDWRELKSALLN